MSNEQELQNGHESCSSESLSNRMDPDFSTVSPLQAKRLYGTPGCAASAWLPEAPSHKTANQGKRGALLPPAPAGQNAEHRMYTRVPRLGMLTYVCTRTCSETQVGSLPPSRPVAWHPPIQRHTRLLNRRDLGCLGTGGNLAQFSPWGRVLISSAHTGSQ